MFMATIAVITPIASGTVQRVVDLLECCQAQIVQWSTVTNHLKYADYCLLESAARIAQLEKWRQWLEHYLGHLQITCTLIAG